MWFCILMQTLISFLLLLAVEINSVIVIHNSSMTPYFPPIAIHLIFLEQSHVLPIVKQIVVNNSEVTREQFPTQSIVSNFAQQKCEKFKDFNAWIPLATKWLHSNIITKPNSTYSN